MKKMKRFLALAMATAMVLVNAVPAFAAKPSVNEAADVKVTNLQKTTTAVSAYKYLDAAIANDGTVTYKLQPWALAALVNTTTGTPFGTEADALDALGVAIGDSTNTVSGLTGKNGQTDNSTATKITDTNAALAILAVNVPATASATVPQPTNTTGTWDATFSQLPAGSYVVLATDSELVYNPMQVAVGWPANANGELQNAIGSGCTAKYTSIPFDKYITSANGGEAQDANGVSRGGDVQVGDIIDYEIKTTVPQYDINTYTAYQFIVSDTLSNGLTPEGDINVVIANANSSLASATMPSAWVSPTYASNALNFKVKWNGQSFTVDFSDIVKDIRGCEITITYQGKLNKDALVGFEGNVNTGKLEYSNDPLNQSSLKPIEKKTYDYTFAIDGTVFGNVGQKSWEYKKTGEGTWTKTNVDEIVSDNAALAGAVFTIYVEDAAGTESLNYNGTTVKATALTNDKLKGSNPFTTGTDGRITFEGLDADKEYYLKETTAPSGYSLNTTVTKFKFVAKYDQASCKLAEYDVVIDGNVKFTYTADVPADPKQVSVTTSSGTRWLDPNITFDDTTEIKNTKLANLPSTGGIGTTIFTITGVILMVAAAGMMLIVRRKREQ